MSSNDLQRFHTAQADATHGYANALAEVRSTGKRTHWIWYIFPQLVGLGQSPQAQQYGLAGRGEALAYLHDPRLRSRLLEITMAVAEALENGSPLLTVMGSAIDALKLVSSLTLFEQISRELSTVEAIADYAALASVAQRVLNAASAQGYASCALTKRALSARAPKPDA